MDPDPQPDPDTPEGFRISLNQLNGNLCRAVGLDPDKVTGFTLVVVGGEIPQLMTMPAPPVSDDGRDLVDPWSGPLDAALHGTTTVVLPGSGTTGPPAQPRWLLPGTPVTDPLYGWASVWLPMALDALNGAPLTDEQRRSLTAQGHAMANLATDTIYQAYAPPPPDATPMSTDAPPDAR